jgi:hypothetical protein
MESRDEPLQIDETEELSSPCVREGEDEVSSCDGEIADEAPLA